MPDGPPEFSTVPEDLFSAAEEVPPSSDIAWWVLHTRPRAEKELARRLRERRVSYFLPLHERRKRFQRRLVVSHLPLFPGYMFLLGDHEARWTAADTNLVVNFLDVPDQQRLTVELKQIHQLINSGAHLTPETRLQPGMSAEIISGALAGIRGIIRQRRGSTSLRFIIEVDLLHQGASVEVDSSMVQPC